MRVATKPPGVMNATRWLALCVVALTASALGGPLEDGAKAYDEGRFESAMALWKPLAEQGHVAAQFNVAILYEKGQGVAQDLGEAARWFLKAAQQGDVDAQSNVAAFYEKGVGVPVDLEKARFWYGRVLTNPGRDRAIVEAKQRARERMRALPPPPGEAEQIVAYQGGRFLVRRAPAGDCVVALQGSVTRDSKAAFEDVLEKAAGSGCKSPLLLLLESPGGLVTDAVALGELVRTRKLNTVARYGCASACSLIFLGGIERTLWGSRAAIGLHQARSVSDRQCDDHAISFATYQIKEYLQKMAPANADRILDITTKTSCNSIEWIRGKRAIELGIATKVEAEDVDVFGPEAERRSAK